MKRTAKRNTKEETRETADSKAVSDEVVEPSVDPKEEASTVEPAEETLDSLRGRIQELENKLLREKADFANTQRRLANERSDAIRFANADLMKSLLPVLDDFERAIEAAAKAQDVEPVLEGTKLVYENFIKALGNHNLEPIKAKSEPFDPTVHEAVLQQPCTDQPEGTVMEEVAKGYRLSDRVIRPAKVIVSKAPDPPADEEETTKE